MQEQRDVFMQDAHRAGHVVRPCFLLQTRIEAVDPKNVDSFEKFVNHFYSFPNKRAEVKELEDPARAAIQEWTKLLEKSDEYSRDSNLWKTVPASPVESDAVPWLHGKLELQWWMLRYCSDIPARRALFFPVKMLYALRVSESSSCQEFSLVEDSTMRQSTRKSLCRIRWFNNQRFRKEKRKREEEEDAPEELDALSEVECVDTADEGMEVEEALDVLADGLPGASTYELVADPALVEIKELGASIGVGADSLLGKGVVVPALDLLMEQVVTQKSLKKLKEVITKLTRYSKEHKCAKVKLISRQILQGWRTIFRSTTCPHSTAAAAIAAAEADAEASSED